MNESNEMKFAEIMTMLGVVFPTNITPVLAKAYFLALDKFTIEQVGAAAEQYIKTGKFFPKPVELTDIINGGKPNSKDKALLAWVSIIDAMKKKGAYRSLTLDDRLAMQIVNHIGGYVNLCSLSYKDLEFKKREFIEAYTTTEKIDDNLLPSSLKGLHEQQANQLAITSKGK